MAAVEVSGADCVADCAVDFDCAAEEALALADTLLVLEEAEVVEVVETCVCVNASPMMVRVYTSVGSGVKEKTSNGAAHSQSS